jgi:transcriptional regulator with XRE-family HTH domain
MGAATLRDRLIEIADDLNSKGVSDAEFARIAKVSRSAVSQWRKGDVKALKALSAANIQERTGYSVRWLILGIGPKKLTDKVSLRTQPDTEQKLSGKDEQKFLVILRSFLDTDDEGRKEIVEAVKAITGNGSSGQQHERKSRSNKRR